jgi:hypothetical protein
LLAALVEFTACLLVDEEPSDQTDDQNNSDWDEAKPLS